MQENRGDQAPQEREPRKVRGQRVAEIAILAIRFAAAIAGAYAAMEAAGLFGLF